MAPIARIQEEVHNLKLHKYHKDYGHYGSRIRERLRSGTFVNWNLSITLGNKLQEKVPNKLCNTEEMEGKLLQTFNFNACFVAEECIGTLFTSKDNVLKVDWKLR